jgi:hypothetical protein
MDDDDRIARLARQIDEDLTKDEHLRLTKTDVTELRREGASELHAICAEFVAEVNRRLTTSVLELAPAEYTSKMFRERGPNLVQVNAQGRIIQIAFEATLDNFSAEKFRIPYILEGEVRAYNQKMLERTQVHSQALFYCLEEKKNTWRFFEWLHGRTGVFGKNQLVSLLERLV